MTNEGEQFQRLGWWPDGMANDDDGEYIDAKEALDTIAKLKARIAELEAELEIVGNRCNCDCGPCGWCSNA